MRKQREEQRKIFKTEKLIIFNLAVGVLDRAIQDSKYKDKGAELWAKYGEYTGSIYKNAALLKQKKDAQAFIIDLPNTPYWQILNLGAVEYMQIKKAAGLL